MQAAISQLEIYLEILETNEPINRAEGKFAQADLEKQNAIEVREALKFLNSAKHVRAQDVYESEPFELA